MQIMRNLIKEGKSVILITHKLAEIKAVADRCTIIRRGKFIDVVDVASTGVNQMAAMMVGRPVSFKVEKKPAHIGRVILDIHDLTVLNSKKLPAVKELNLNVRSGEIVGIAGVDGNGQSELIEAITGLRPIVSGLVSLDGNDITNAPIRTRNEIGLGHIPEDRQRRGLVLTSAVYNNIAIKEYYHTPFSNHGLLNISYLQEYAQRVIEQFDVRSGEGIFSHAGKLSGGNQQKLIVGREIVANPQLLIAVQPTRGLDVGAIEYIHSQLVAHRDKGHAVLLVSFELDEIFNLSDRIAVMHSGKIMDVVLPNETDEAAVGLMMTGIATGGTAND